MMNKKNALRIMLIILMLGAVSIPLISCKAKAATSANQVATVQRGNLSIDITSGGNLALSQKEDLAFDVGGTSAVPVTVAEILVTEGEAVTKGQVIARLDTVPLDDAVRTAELAVANAEIALEDAKDGDFKVKTAEYDLQTAVDNFNKINYPYTKMTFTESIPTALVDMRQALNQMDDVKKGFEAGPGTEDYDNAKGQLAEALTNLNSAYETLNRGQTITADMDPNATWDLSKAYTDYQTARSAAMAVEKAQQTLEQTKRSTKSTLDKANLALEKAQDDLKKAQDNVAKAVITAPFAGFITSVNVEGGDEIQKGTVAVSLADPAKFEAKIMVGEKDIFQVKEGGTATIQIDSMSVIVLPAKVAHISPTGTVSSGVVNYQVTIEADSTATTGLSGQGQPTSPGSSQTRPSSGSSQTAPSSTNSPRVSGLVTQTSQLREGLSVTVNIIVAESKNVLMVPVGAITRSGRDTTVQVMKNGTPETRTVKTGISSWQYTEVTEGLSEGEQVVVPKTTAPTTTTSSQNQNRPGGFMIPGVGR